MYWTGLTSCILAVSHVLIISVVLQSYINLGIAKTLVYFRIIRTVAVHGEYNALYLICLLLMLEMYFHALTLQVGKKYVLVTVPTDFDFEYV